MKSTLSLLCCAAITSVAQDFTARSIQVDPSFTYYRDRSPESIAAELKANGYGWMRYFVVRDSVANAHLVDACRKAGLTVSFTTLGNGVYHTGDLPAGWENWKMKCRDPQAHAGSYTYLCMNHPEYRRWKKEAIVGTLRRISFDGFEIMECFWPAFNGPASPLYGCLCDHCAAAFRRMFPGETHLPDFADAQSPRHYQTNRALYTKWIEFRAQSVASFLDGIVNGPGGVREKFPKRKVIVWGIADDIPNAVEKLREWEGIDGPLLVRTVRPDIYVLQTDWPDWTKPDLTPEYLLAYKPFVHAIRATGSKIPIHAQSDIGSHENCRRSREWMRQCEQAAEQIGISSVTAYEYHLSLDIYEAPPKPVSVSGSSNVVTLVFNKRLSVSSATNLASYIVKPGRAVSAQVDGNLVHLKVEGRPRTVTARNLADDPARRFFKHHPPVVMPRPAPVAVDWGEVTPPPVSSASEAENREPLRPVRAQNEDALDVPGPTGAGDE